MKVVRRHDQPSFFYLGGRQYIGIDPRRCPPFREFSCDDWVARRDGVISKREYRDRVRRRAALGLKGTDPLPHDDCYRRDSAVILPFAPRREDAVRRALAALSPKA